MANYLYVDRSNIWIEGMHVLAVRDGYAPSIWHAQTQKITRPWRMDFGKLMEFAGGELSNVGRAVLYGSRPPPSDSLWKAAEAQGFEVVVFDRNVANKEKKIDTKIATDMTADSFLLMEPAQDEVTLVAGDSDYVPTVELLISRGFKVYVCFWDHASRELKEACTKFISLNAHLDYLTFNDD